MSLDLLPIHIENIQLPMGLALAPMAGLSDVPFRTLAHRFGATHLVSEMVSSQPELWDTGKSRLRRVPVPGALPAVQMAGTDPRVMAQAAQRLVDEGVALLDLNFGCPVKKVCRKSAGSAMLGDLDLLTRIVAAVVEAVDVPVTIKTRVGLTPQDDFGLQAVLRAEQAGAAMAVVHARSRACRFRGAVDYRRLAPLSERLTIPLLVNGDIDSAARAQQALSQSGADGIMVGRAAVGRPWLFAELAGRPLPGLEARWQVVLEHIESIHSFYGQQMGVGLTRKHVIAYLAEFDQTARKAQFLRLTSAAAQLAWLRDLATDSLRQAA